MLHTNIWSDMMQLGIPLAEKIIRPVIVYGFLVVALRLGGRRELAQLNPFDLVVLLTLSNTVQNAIIGNDNSLLGGLVGATALLITNYAVVRFLYTHEKIERIVEGESEVVIDQGRINEDALKKELITEAELKAAARRQGFDSLDEIERAVIDPNGTLSFFARQPAPHVARHEEVTQRLDRLTSEVRQIRRHLAHS